MQKKIARVFIILLLVAMVAALTACTIDSDSKNPFDKEPDDSWVWQLDKKQTIEKTTDAISNLRNHLNKEIVAETGYYIEFDMDFDSSDGSHFTLKLKANLHTFPHYVLDEDGKPIEDENGKPVIDPEKEKIHNEIIKSNDLIVEWYDGHANKLLVGLYFDGKNSSLSNPGNNLYLNLRGETKRMFKDFGDTVMYRQLIRLITSIDIEKMLGNDEEFGGAMGTLGGYLDMAVSDNYKTTQNDEVMSIFYSQVNLDMIADSSDLTGGNSVTEIIQGIFGPFGNKIDPLTEYYLGFKFSTPGTARVRTLTTDLRVLIQDEGGTELMTGLEIAANGTALSRNEIVSFETDAKFSYEPRVQADLRVISFIDASEFKEYKNGQYEYNGELYVPMMEQQNMESRMDAVVRTKLTSDVNRNDENRIQMSFTDKANGSRLLLGAYYCNERTYLNTTGLQNLYGGIKINEIGFPRAYIDGPNIAQLLTEFYDTVNDIITDYVDGVVDGSGSSVLFDEIMAKMTSGEETISIRIDLELIKIVLRETQEGNPEYTTQDIIDMLSGEIGYDLEEIAFMLGIPDAKRMLEKTWFDITYNVVTSAITIKMSTNAMNENVTSLIFQLDLFPVKIGEDVTFPAGFDTWFDDYKQLQEVKTISASMSGTVKFANGAAVDISDLLGAMIGDKSGLNTKYFLPASSSLGFSLVFDQYVKFDDYEGDVYPGDDWENQIGEMRGRIGFKLQVWEQKSQGGTIPILNVYAKDVAFNTNCEEEDLGYVWVDIQATKFTKVKIREDVFLASLTDYMGGNSAAGDAMALSIPQIIGALLEDSNEINFLPDVIQFATSNKTIQKLFGVKAVHMEASVDVGLTPRVTGITQLEGDFADYTVGELSDMTGDDHYSAGVYEKNLHDVIAVTFYRDGNSWVEYLRVPYYRVSAPRDVSDYDSQEDYDAAVAKYQDYLASLHSLEVVDGKSMYYPSTDGNFMGQFRSYTVEIRRSGGSSLTSVTSKVLELAETDLVWEPLEEKPSRILGTIRNGSVTVPADFALDWSTVTLDGLEKAQYTVVIGPGSIGEATFTVFITVRNRRIVQENGSQSDTAAVYPSLGDAKNVPVASEISIDPYDYILWRGEYVVSNGGVPENPIGLYLMSRSDLKSVVFRFGDGQSERVSLGWSFDAENSGGLNNEIYITAEGGNALYAHAYFHNQLVALRIKVLKKEFDCLLFDGETEQGVYTVDVLNSASKTIPLRPTVYFKDGTSRRFPFDFQWAFPVADNVTLNGAEIIDGKESPFSGHVGNDNAAWLSVQQNYGEAAAWFKDVYMQITVKAPAKTIENIYKYEDGGNTYYARDVMLDGGEIQGYWVVDPLKPRSKYLPASLTAYFIGEDNVRSERHYGADIIRFDDKGKNLLSEKSPDGNYLITEPNGIDKTTVRTYVVTGWISDEFSFDLILAVLPTYDANEDTLVFFDKDGNPFDQSSIKKDAADPSKYLYSLDPFQPLFLPNLFEIRADLEKRKVILTSADGANTEAYSFRYNVTPEVRSGNFDLQYQYVISGDIRFTAYLQLEPEYRLSDLKSIVLQDARYVIGTEQINNGYNFDKFRLDGEGYVLDNEERRIVVNGSEAQLADYIRYLFTNVEVKLSGGLSVTVNPKILDFERFDVQSTISEAGATYFVAFSEIEKLMNISIVLRSDGLDQVIDGNAPSLLITPFTADGKEVYPYGYQLYSQEFTVRYSGDKSVSFRSSRWTVAQTTNLKGQVLPIGTEISVISPEILRAERENDSEEAVLVLYAFLPDSSRINLTVRISPLDIQTFVSAENELFPIKAFREGGRNYSAVEVKNLYVMRSYLVDADSFISYLPTTVKIGGTELRDVKWIADAELEENLKNLTYTNRLVSSGITEFKLSTAEVRLGSEENPYPVLLELYVRFLPCVLDSVVPDATFGDATGVYFEPMQNENGFQTVKIRVKPYAAPVGVNSFAFPSTYTAKFINFNENYQFPLRIYYDGSDFGDALYFDYNGTSFRNFVGGDDKNRMTFVLDAGYGQQIRVILEFIDQTVETLASGFSDIGFGTSVNGVYDVNAVDTSTDKISARFVIDPYGKKYTMPSGASMYIPNYVKINYTKSGGAYSPSSNLNVQWNEYTARFGGQELTELTGVIVRQGFTTQTVKINYEVKDRSAVQENVAFRSETLADGGVEIFTTGVGMPTAHIKNPFTFRVAADLPKTVQDVTFTDGTSMENIPIYWEMTDTDVDYSGNNMSVKPVRYRLYDENGQQFTFYLRLDRWEYVSLEREVSGNWQEMNPIYFQISSVSGESDLTSFRIQFRVTDAMGSGTTNQSQIFYSETSKEVTSEKRGPVLYFDQAAIELATANGTEVQGTFSLGDEGKLRYEIQRSMATVKYTSARPSITDSYFYYKVLTTDYYSPFVLIDPLNPVWPTELYAYVNWTKELVKLEITEEGDPFGVDTLRYLNRGGGVIIGRSVYVLYRDPKTGNEIRFKHKIDILFLDRTVRTPLRVAQDGTLPTSAEVVFLDNYTNTTYAGRANPYSDSYDRAMYSLNLALRIYASSADVTDIVWDTETKTSVSFRVNGVTYGSVDTPCTILRYETAMMN